MLIEGNIALRAPIQKLWEALLDPETLASCMPGAEKVEKIDDKTYEAIVKQKVGPIKIKLKFKNVLKNVEPPTHMEVDGEGHDVTKLGHFKQSTLVDLKDLGNGEVEISYKANVNVVGKLATFGDRIMKSKAKDVEREFTENLRLRLQSIV